ncbi:bifunctional metallophosphatase/5'-nucleotidase [Candidatus Villigracilis saccharophilus]|uniref:bifunctional metallophosphatase/5'-nucleotidase n=1 Tax=Candidatus Villigracilis saccharophilus TaxID=3140684 RepID=UPI003137658A|nr:bifunctional metallophosphatase/5'-nucleotidase [Anaerolineales bacterium]
MKNKKVFSILLLLVLLSTLIVSTVSAKPSPTVDVQILAVNDFHGNLEPPAGSSGRIGTINAGGAEYLATHINTLRALNPNTVVVSAGDMIGASPLLSALFHDEPSIEAFNAMGLDFNAVGNHEFDEGFVELLRMQKGGCHPVDGCLDGDDFAGAKFKYLAANVVFNDSDDEDDDDSKKNKDEDLKTLFPAYKIREFNSVKVAFIGMTLEGTPSIVTPSGVAGLTFLDEADTVNALIPELKKEGVQTIVVLIHEGGAQVAPAPYNGCEGISGAIVDIVNRFDPEVDVVISGHTHNAYNCTINNMLVTSAASFGRVVTDVDLTINRKSGEVVSMSANNNIVTRDVAKDGFITALIAKYNAIAAPLANRVIGVITATITRTNNAAGESALGDVIADAQLYATADPANGGAVIAFMNPGGIRTDLNFAGSTAGEGDGKVTYGESFAVQPFGNNLTTITMTGTQIKAVLEQQFNNPAAGQNRILQISNGFTYSWSLSAPVGSKISNMMLNGVAISDTSTYRVTVNSFLADGGDNFFAFKDGTDRLGGAVDTDALEKYFVAFPLVAPGPQNRITVLP